MTSGVCGVCGVMNKSWFSGNGAAQTSEGFPGHRRWLDSRSKQALGRVRALRDTSSIASTRQSAFRPRVGLDPLERATALLRAELLFACEDVALSLTRSDAETVLHVDFKLRIDGIPRQASYPVALNRNSTRGAEKLAIRAALADVRRGIEAAVSFKGPLAHMGPVSLPTIHKGGHRHTMVAPDAAPQRR